MAYRGKPVMELPQEETLVWSCENPDCNGWIRDGFSFASVPVCPLCQSSMVSSVKMLPQLVNASRYMRS